MSAGTFMWRQDVQERKWSGSAHLGSNRNSPALTSHLATRGLHELQLLESPVGGFGDVHRLLHEARVISSYLFR